MKKILFLLLALTVKAQAVTTPALFGTPTTSTVVVTGATAFTFSHIVPAGGTDTLLLAQGFGTATTGNQPASGMTFNGVSMTRLKSSYITNGALTHQTDLFYLKSPQAMTANIIVTFPATVAQLGGNAINYSGVDQNIVFGATSATAITASPANVTTTITTLYDNSLLLYNWEAYAIGAGGSAYTKDAGYTDRAFSGFISAAAAGDLGDKASTSAGSYSVATTFNNGGSAFSGCSQQLIELVGTQPVVSSGGILSPYMNPRQSGSNFVSPRLGVGP